MTDLTQLGWNEMFALMDHYKLDDTSAAQVFGFQPDTLETARELKANGTIVPCTDIDFSQYDSLLGVKKPAATDTSTSANKPATATKPTRTPKKRGRKGSKIANAFAAIPAEPTDATAFISEHNISMAVLRQAKRFDRTGLDGAVHVRKDKESGNLVVWRDAPAAE